MASVYLGQIVQFGFQFAPRGFAFCNGALLSISQNSALFSLLGTTYGGNGTINFALPNLNGRAAIGQFQSAGTSNYVIGQSGGTESTTLTTGNLPAHNHAVQGSQTKGSLQAPAAGSFVGKGVDAGGTAVPQIYVPAGSEGTVVPMGGTGLTGGNQPISILDPYLAINYCIATSGIFPSRN